MTDAAKALAERLRNEDSYYRIQEKHWCIDAEELERQRLAAADLIETHAREIEQLREALQFYARENSWRSCGMYMSGRPNPYSAEIDRGDKARAALGESHD